MVRQRRHISFAVFRRHALLSGIAGIMLFPILWGALTSIKRPGDIFSLMPLSGSPTLANYQVAMTTVPLVSMVVYTATVAALVALGVVTLSLGAAYALARWNFPGKQLCFFIFIGVLLVPVQVTIIPNYLLLAHVGWLNSLTGLVIPQLASGFGVYYLHQQLKRFPQEIFDAADIDGASHLRILWSIVLPTFGPTLTALGILLFAQTWNEYFWPLLVAQDAQNTIVQVGLQRFLQANGLLWGPLMAFTMVTLVPPLCLYAIAQRRFATAFQ